MKSPSKFLSRSFLARLKDERFISPGGVEYCPEEVMQDLIEKESRLAPLEYDRQLTALAAQLEAASKVTSSIPLIVSKKNCVKKEQTAAMNNQQNGGGMSNKRKKAKAKSWPGPVERRLKLTSKPKELSFDDTVALLGEFGEWIDDRLEAIRNGSFKLS